VGMAASGNRNNSRKALSEINVTPLVDVMLVLLIMFMVTAPLMQQGIEVELPKTSATGVEINDEPFVISIAADRTITAAKNNLRLEDIRTRLKSIMKNRKNKQVFLQADKKADYGIVAEVMAEIRAAGIYNIGLITLPKEQ
jgi:biopolymer transport protein TolR